jgi:hypothetical protein
MTLDNSMPLKNEMSEDGVSAFSFWLSHRKTILSRGGPLWKVWVESLHVHKPYMHPQSLPNNRRVHPLSYDVLQFSPGQVVPDMCPVVPPFPGAALPILVLSMFFWGGEGFCHPWFGSGT